MISQDQDMPRGPKRPSETVESDMRQRIEAGEWAAGEALPTVGQLAEYYGVARTTITRVLRALEDDHLIEIVARWGTFRK